MSYERRSYGPRTMYEETCADCGKECEVPFKPISGKFRTIYKEWCPYY